MSFKKYSLIKNASIITVAVIMAIQLTGCGGLEGNAAVRNTANVSHSGDVLTEEAKKGDISMTIQGAGFLLAARAVNLYYTDLSGPLKKVHVMLGDEVKPGQPIMEIDVKQVVDDIKAKELELRLLELKSQQNDQSIAINKVNVAQAEKDMELAEKANSVESTLVTKNSLERIRTEYEEAKNNLKNAAINKEMSLVQVSLARTELDKLKARLQQGTLTSPVHGKVVFLDRIYETEQISSGRVLARIAEPSDIVFQMVASEAKNIQGTFEASLTIGGDKCPVQLYSPKPGDQLEQSDRDQKIKNKVYFSFKDSIPKLELNEPGQAIVDISKRGVLLIPKSAVREEAGKATVDVMKSGSVETVEILTGLTKDDVVEVLGGIEEGTKVLVK